MKLIFKIVLFIVFCTSSYCQNKSETLIINPESIQESFKKWNTYYTDSIMLSSEYEALDENSNLISKELFLKTLSDGKYIPLKLKSKSDLNCYKLFAINSKSDSSISATIMESAFNELQNFKKEGTFFPIFSFKDINGKLINNEFLKGKTVIIKCWYIHCAQCIKEFPDVNKLANKYKNKKEVVFLSLAEDSTKQLKLFLKKKPLNYIVIPNMKQYMNETLQLNAFPTHYLIDKEGKIIKVLSNFKSLEFALEKYPLKE
jgi:peroxiredoxin